MKNLVGILLSAALVCSSGFCFAQSDLYRAAELRDVKSADRLIEYLKDKDWYYRIAAAAALGERGERRAVERLLEMLQSEDSCSMRTQVALALSEIKDARAVAPLINILNGRDSCSFDYRLNEFLIAIIKEASDAYSVLPALKAERPDVLKAAADALDRLGWKPTSKDDEIDYLMARNDWAGCVQLGADAVTPLGIALNNIYWLDFFHDIASALGKINDPRAFAALSRSLNAEYGEIPAAIAAKLAEIKDPQAIQSIKERFKTPVNWNAQIVVAEVMGEQKDPRAVNPLMTALNDIDERVRAKAAEALGRMKALPAQSALVAALMDKRSAVREAAARALDDIGWKSSDPKENAAYFAARQDAQKCLELGSAAVEPLLLPLAQRFADEDAHAFAVATLTKMGAPAVEPLIAAFAKDYGNPDYGLQEEGRNIRWAAAGILGDINDPRAVEPLIKALSVDPGALFRDADLQGAVVVALGKLKSPQATEALIRLLKDEQSGTRKYAAGALRQIGRKPSSDEERAAYCIAGQDWDACEKLGAIVVDPLIRLLDVKNGIDAVPDHAAQVLGKIKDARAIKPLVYALSKYDFFNDEGIRAPETVEESLAGFGALAVDALLEAFSAPLVVVSRYDLASGKLDWKIVFDKLIQNGWAIEIDTARLLITVDWRKEKDRMSQAFGDDFKRIVNFFEFRTLIPRRDLIAQTLALIGDKRAVSLLAANLQDWKARYAVAEALRKLGWQPETEREKVYYALNGGNADGKQEPWEIVEKVLLEDVGSDDERAVAYALYIFISRGKEEVIPKLVDVLNAKGTVMLAEAYLNCGQKELAVAAGNWAAAHGYSISEGKGNAPVSWGSR